MKTQRSFANLAFLFGIASLMLLARPHAAQAATCGFVHPHTDGRVLGPYAISNATNDIGVDFNVTPGRSYVFEVMQQGGNGFGISPTINIHTTNVCPTADATSGVTVRNITCINPLHDQGGAQSRSLVILGNPEGIAVRVRNPTPALTDYVLSVTETTMFSPGWSTMGGTQTFWSFLNTTNATLNGTLTLLDTLGTQVAALGVGILPNRAVFPSTITMAIAAGQAGTARFIHDGPPGAILAEGAITNFITFFQRVRFDPVRERR